MIQDSIFIYSSIVLFINDVVVCFTDVLLCSDTVDVTLNGIKNKKYIYTNVLVQQINASMTWNEPHHINTYSSECYHKQVLNRLALGLSRFQCSTLKNENIYPMHNLQWRWFGHVVCVSVTSHCIVLAVIMMWVNIGVCYCVKGYKHCIHTLCG